MKIIGLKDDFDNESWDRMRKVWEVCKAADVSLPDEVREYFGDAADDDDFKPGEHVGIDLIPFDCVTKVDSNTYEIDFTDLPDGIERVRVIED